MAIKLIDDENTLIFGNRTFKAAPMRACKNCQFGKQKDTKFCKPNHNVEVMNNGRS